MSETWVTVIALAAVCAAMRTAVPLLLGERRPQRLDHALTFAIPALLAALIVTGTLIEGRGVRVDPRLAGVAVPRWSPPCVARCRWPSPAPP